MLREDYLWIGIKLLGLWIALLAIGALFEVLDAGVKYQLYGMIEITKSLESSSWNADSLRASSLAYLVVGACKLVVWSVGSYFFLRRTDAVVKRLSKPPASSASAV